MLFTNGILQHCSYKPLQFIITLGQYLTSNNEHYKKIIGNLLFMFESKKIYVIYIQIETMEKEYGFLFFLCQNIEKLLLFIFPTDI